MRTVTGNMSDSFMRRFWPYATMFANKNECAYECTDINDYTPCIVQILPESEARNNFRTLYICQKLKHPNVADFDYLISDECASMRIVVSEPCTYNSRLSTFVERSALQDHQYQAIIWEVLKRIESLLLDLQKLDLDVWDLPAEQIGFFFKDGRIEYLKIARPLVHSSMIPRRLRPQKIFVAKRRHIALAALAYYCFSGRDFSVCCEHVGELDAALKVLKDPGQRRYIRTLVTRRKTLFEDDSASSECSSYDSFEKCDAEQVDEESNDDKVSNSKVDQLPEADCQSGKESVSTNDEWEEAWYDPQEAEDVPNGEEVVDHDRDDDQLSCGSLHTVVTGEEDVLDEDFVASDSFSSGSIENCDAKEIADEKCDAVGVASEESNGGKKINLTLDQLSEADCQRGRESTSMTDESIREWERIMRDTEEADIVSQNYKQEGHVRFKVYSFDKITKEKIDADAMIECSENGTATVLDYNGTDSRILDIPNLGIVCKLQLKLELPSRQYEYSEDGIKILRKLGNLRFCTTVKCKEDRVVALFRSTDLGLENVKGVPDVLTRADLVVLAAAVEVAASEPCLILENAFGNDGLTITVHYNKITLFEHAKDRTKAMVVDGSMLNGSTMNKEENEEGYRAAIGIFDAMLMLGTLPKTVQKIQFKY